MKKKMYKKLVGFAGMTIMVLLGCIACSQEIPDSLKREEQNTITEESEVDEKEDNAKENKGSDFAEADLQGSVVDFSDSEFKLSPAAVIKNENGEEIMMQAAPGAEKEEDLMTITYAEGVTFQILTMDSVNKKEISREDVDRGSVKKQSSVLIYGSCQDTYHWTAEKVIIVRWE